MDSIQSLAIGFQYLAENPQTILLLVIAVFGGMVFGAIPGLTAALGVTLMLPFTFAMPSQQGLAILIGIYVGGISGGLVSAMLLNIPGSPASIVTTFDGAPMARNGRPGDALSLGVFGSLIGGLLSAVALIVISPQLAKVALAFGPWEYFAMGLMGLSVVISICSKDLKKGFMSAIIGLLLATVGIDPVSAAQRFTFGFWQLGAGMDILAALMGLFAIAEILTQLRTIHLEYETTQVEKLRFFPRLQLVKESKLSTYLIGSALGTFVGILPGVGQSTASLLSYNTVRQVSHNPEKFGSGCAEGVVASEAANNACCGGALIPMMTMGIPGDVVTAILLGGLIVHGLQPGPLLFSNNQDIVGIIFVAYVLANIFMYVMLMSLMRVFIKLLAVPLNFLFPLLLLMCVIGTITVHNRLFDSWILLFVGVVGYILVNCGFSLPPIVLGFVLAPIIESNFRIALITNKGSVSSLFEAKIAVGLLIFAVIMIIWPMLMKLIKRIRQKEVVTN
jgi:putative tricarboxylic transport membrane protein